jgi:hypothetical protein
MIIAAGQVVRVLAMLEQQLIPPTLCLHLSEPARGTIIVVYLLSSTALGKTAAATRLVTAGLAKLAARDASQRIKTLSI